MIKQVLQKSTDQSVFDEAFKIYMQNREANKTSPSFYIYCSQLFHAAGAENKLSSKIISNTLEMNVQDTQLFRAVAYFMLQIGLLQEAITLFRRVQDKAPAEPQSFMDLGLALFIDCRKKLEEGASIESVKPQFIESCANIANVLTGSWVSRFAEVEYPALIWLNWVVCFAKFKGLDVWPETIPAVFRLDKFKLDVFVAMGWDTDNTDIDLHVYEPDGTHVYYGNKCGRLSKDFTQGYGPECYTNKGAKPGLYKVNATYYGSGQVSKSTGTTSAILWSVQDLGHFECEKFTFRAIRLDKNKSNMDVLKVLQTS